MASFLRKHVVEKLAFQPPNPPTYDSVDDLAVHNGTFIKHVNAGKALSEDGLDYVLLYSHGNGEDLGTIETMLTFLSGQLCAEIVAYDYKGYGPFQEGARPSEETAYQSINNALAYLLEQGIGPEKIVLVGRSLGSGPTCHLAKDRVFAGVVLISPLTSAVRTQIQFGIPAIDIFDNLSKIKSITAPLMIVHGRNDRIVPFNHGEQLYESAISPHTFLQVDDAGHNDVLVGSARAADFVAAMQEFLLNLYEIE
jgi:pimeloyl-ACP methyl ester carboxylesterase